MGWSQGPPTWAEMERVLDGRLNPHAPPGDGGDGPAWSRKRQPYEPPPRERGRSVVPYAELHAHSAFSFLDGASLPEEMVQEAARLDLKALAITDHDGFYGVVRFAEAAKELGLPTVFGAELSLGGQGNTEDSVHLLVLARGQEGYRRLSRQMAGAHLSGGTPKDRKGKPRYDLDALTEAAGGHWHILTGCRKGHVRRALAGGGPVAAERALANLVDRFGADRVSIELNRHGHPGEDERNAELAALARGFGVGVIATTAAHFATPESGRLAMAMAAVRARKSLDDAAGWLDPVGGAHLRSGDEMARLFSHYPEVVTAAAELGEECAFDLRLIAPQLPPFDVPSGHTEDSWLRHLALEGAARRYGPRAGAQKAYAQIERELEIIAQLNFPGYFLVVHDITQFCRRSDILCQGRGSAANSAVCYALGVTNVDPVANGLLFERFLSPARDGPPDIDIDIESDEREQAIQYVYNKYGREYAAQVANVITYRGRMAVRDMAKALGFAQGQQDAWSKQMGHWGGLADAAAVDGIPPQVIQLARQIKDFPRHMGIHSGGMVICDRPLADVVPVEWARMENRSVLQWDKDDCAAVGLVKFDLLGLGMLSALHYCIDLVREHKGIDVDLAHIDLKEQAVYEMLARADSVGVFQVESRAQMATLPRLKPKCFYDLVVEVALIRPGPIQGGSVHPYIRRYNKIDKDWQHDHPSMAAALDKTLGVPLFQEQLMQLAVDVAGFSPAESDQLRRAMGSKRSPERMERLRNRFYEGMRNLHGITGELADRIYEKLYAFANFGFPESHAQSFASLVFYSSWFKLHHPAAFCAALLRAQPMGFYSPQSLVADARRHGVTVHGPDVNASLSYATLENAGLEVRIGLGAVRHIGDDLAQAIVEERKVRGPFVSLLDLTGRIQLTTAQVEALATGGALGCFDMSRREALWVAGAAAAQRPDRLPGVGVSSRIPALPEMGEVTRAAADVWATGVSPDSYPTQFLRARLDAMGVVPAKGLFGVPDGSRVLVAGAVTHRQCPATAAGVTFINLEDETGMVNVVCSVGLWARYRKLAVTARALIIRGQVQNASGAVSVVADQLRPLDLQIRSTSRDFR
ncbi:error-prone DNA polymerase [Mycobacteroides abscessus subsp. abscessus]|uniref:error-prone DNA polymerase n=1 Tax=Mycobacteroides abscessus TaxID=36809 RepID=UPI00066685E6|nr:error-prone DNA polymerase [Mycobacteroides abscessus]AKP59581.1 DNA polymerase [Mycobacteroides abscessus UC22]MDM2173710.1 error-prone DNA polymerase [Mycobacteroides abscessus]MDM2177166.1 error-prone DNA polymerase [Mycobacteroides abscessus]MDM2206627.1 error-prone DNA polymerase [Mycobacteroides abscessus]MDM2211238.1 error-prone DNA polymerase [Mycobacteroides abscessus]